jgi:hypothetical protein
MLIVIRAYDKYGLCVLGNLYGQRIFEAKDYRRTKHYKDLKAGNFAQDRIEQYKIYASLGYDSEQLLETVYIQDLT